jgi:hypothetical protein
MGAYEELGLGFVEAEDVEERLEGGAVDGSGGQGEQLAEALVEVRLRHARQDERKRLADVDQHLLVVREKQHAQEREARRDRLPAWQARRRVRHAT